MATPVAKTYSGLKSQQTLYGGRKDAGSFLKVNILSQNPSEVPYTNPGQVLVVDLHGSGGGNLGAGRQYRADCDGLMAYGPYTKAEFHTIRGSTSITYLRPYDGYGFFANASKRESMWQGFNNCHVTGKITLMTQRRLDAMMSWAEANVPNVLPNKTCLTGNSMGGWGTMTYGLRRPHRFAALYAIQPRWRYNETIGKVAVGNYLGSRESVFVASAPNVSIEDGDFPIANLMDNTTYVSNTANKLPWMGWCVGRLDGFVQFQDHVDAVIALRAAKRGFAFIWNNGNHTTGGLAIMYDIWASYPYGTFEIGKGYPLFTEHSLDQDPATDLVGGINIGLSFRNLVETAEGWSCEVTSIISACTVKVEPISDVFKSSVTSQLVTIPAANTWVTVTFSA